MTDDRLKIGPDTAAALVAEQFPAWADLPVSPVMFPSWDNRVFHLGDDLLLKLPSAVRYAGQPEKDARWLPFFRERLSFAVPEHVALGKPSAVYPYHWSVLRWLPGETASTSGREENPAFAASLGAAIAELRGLDAENGPAAGEQNFHRGGKLDTYTPEVKAEIVRWEEASGGDAPEQMQRVWQNALSSRWDRPPVWVHGDMAPGNVLLDARGQFLGLIDFGSLGVGDPACDGTMLWTFFRGAAREAFQAAIEFDAATWDRARGWALWKAAITAAKGGSVGRAGANTLRFVLSDAP